MDRLAVEAELLAQRGCQVKGGTPEWKVKLSKAAKGKRRKPRKDATCDHPDRKAKAFGLCTSCYRKHYYQAHIDKEIGNAKRWSTNPEHRERVLAAKRKYNHKPDVVAYTKEYKKQYRADHREQVRATNRAYRARLREQKVYADFKKWWVEKSFHHGGAASLSRFRRALFAFQAGHALKK